MISKALYTSNSDEFQTPTWILDAVRQIAPIQTDLASQQSNPTGAANFYTRDRPYGGEGIPSTGLVFVNPPYSQMAAWSGFIAKNASVRREMIALVASRTDTKWFSTLTSTPLRPYICFLRGRLKFLVDGVSAKSCAPFPSAVFYWGCDAPKFCSVFGNHGNIFMAV